MWLVGLLMLAEFCGITCTTTAWELQINHEPVVAQKDMSKEDCGALAQALDPQIPPFSLVQCVEVNIQRQDG
jgi:hypothetical protein